MGNNKNNLIRETYRWEFSSLYMGWNKRSFSNRYDSLSGHALIISCFSKKIITGILSSKICRQSSKAEENGEKSPETLLSQKL